MAGKLHEQITNDILAFWIESLRDYKWGLFFHLFSITFIHTLISTFDQMLSALFLSLSTLSYNSIESQPLLTALFPLFI